MIASQNIECKAYRSLNHMLPRVEEIQRSGTGKDDLGWKQIASRLHEIFSCVVLTTISHRPIQHISKDHNHEK